MELELSTGHIGSYVFNDVGAVMRATATRHGLTTFSPDRSTYLPKAVRSRRDPLRNHSPEKFRRTGSYGFSQGFDPNREAAASKAAASRQSMAQERDLEAIRKGIKQRERLRNFPLTMGSDPCANLLPYLHTVDKSTGRNCPNLRIPTTVFMDNGEVTQIYFTDKRGVLRMKSKLNTDLDVALAELTRNPMTTWREYPVATQRFPNKDFQHATEVDYEMCVELCDRKSAIFYNGPCVLQRYLLPNNGNRIGFIVAVWTRKAVHMEWNSVQVARRNGRIVPGSKKVLAEQMPLRRGNRLYQRILEACDSIARHVEAVSPQGYKFAFMELVFKLDDLGKLNFCWANKLKLTSEQDEAERQSMLDSIYENQRWNAKVVQERSRKMSEVFRTAPDIFERKSQRRYQASQISRNRSLVDNLANAKLPRLEAGSLAQIDSSASHTGADSADEEGGEEDPSGEVDWDKIATDPGRDENDGEY